MLVTLCVQLYISRVILNALGVSDYGIYNVVGGVVSMFAFLSNTMATATQRFMSYAIGQDDINDLRKTFVVSQIILWIIAIIAFLLVETIGLWLLYNHLSIPADRFTAAFYVFQFSVISLFITIISVPFNAAIIAHEKMSIYAKFSLIDIFMKLGVAIILLYIVKSIDKLIVYAFLIMLISVIMRGIYIYYCKKNFTECSNNIIKYDNDKGEKMLSFFGWNTIGSLSYVAKEQGINILINIFFGTIVNAARGITSQVTGAVQGFISNFQVAMNPQITKYYASGEYNNLFILVQRGSKFSLFLFFFLALPIFIDIDYILKLWLVDVPAHTPSFIRLTFILMMIESMSSPVITCLLAVGKVKWYQIIVGGLLILNLPISYIILKLGGSPESTIYVAIIISSLSLLIRLIMLKRYINFPIIEFATNVIYNAIIVVLISSSLSILLFKYIPIKDFTQLIVTLINTWIISGFVILFIGLNKNERKMVISMTKNIIKKIKLK